MIDRSISIYILEKLNQRCGKVTKEHFENIIMKEFFQVHQVLKIRLTEKRYSGAIKIENGCITLTSRGKFIA